MRPEAFFIASMLAQAAPATPLDSKVVIWTFIAGTATTLITSFFGYLNSRQARIEAKEAKTHAEASVSVAKSAADTAAQVAEGTSKQIDTIKNSVNGDRTIMIQKMDRLEEVIIKMTQERLQMEEQARSAQQAVPEMIRVLVYDDDPQFLGTVKSFLEREDGPTKFTVDVETDDAKARASFMLRKHDAYVVDYRLGKGAAGKDLDGLEFIRGLRGAAHMGPFVLLSAHVDKTLETKALNEGVQMLRTKESVIRGDLAMDIRNAIQAFRAAQRATQ